MGFITGFLGPVRQLGLARPHFEPEFHHLLNKVFAS